MAAKTRLKWMSTSWPTVYIHTCTHTHTHARAHAHTHTHARVHAYTQTHTQTNVRTECHQNLAAILVHLHFSHLHLHTPHKVHVYSTQNTSCSLVETAGKGQCLPTHTQSNNSTAGCQRHEQKAVLGVARAVWDLPKTTCTKWAKGTAIPVSVQLRQGWCSLWAVARCVLCQLWLSQCSLRAVARLVFSVSCG